ncbi:hypothetical protein AMS68_007053 [Peltaster fructicola]|uniref:NADP-dependent oxidoreductase domain-containing protein n=1 Tax=Peltaster fructicola TaxID=286661 RepID=A0A6H0Y3K6_9PEZI|nr:hypothetical protein AMS68_007053 [Peltaster fructicola]
MASSYSGTTFKLNTGASIPALGFGTWQDKDAQESAVLTALKAGYRHIDTARVYGTEPAVGKAIKESGIPREEIFVTTKLWNNSHAAADVEPALDASLKDLGLEYVDLYLMHWPSPFKSGDNLFPKDDNDKTIPGDSDYVETWKAMEAVAKKGKAKAIGISNFSKAEVERLLEKATVVPAAHQIELHPYLQQASFQEFHDSKGIHVTQYSPFGNQNQIYESGKSLGKLIEDQTLVEVGKKYNKSGAQTALAWGIAHGRTVIPKSKTESRIKDNLQGDFKLDAADVKKIDSIDKKIRFNDPSGSFGWNFYTDLDGKK